ncbi:hypothetical protein [Ligilactobacillus salivarius]|uniref:Uncharacterized protein n=1 Tax=Ligilactobacillus salivarius TaxID=1624 RepID=A0A9X6S5T2_9LACO|nr:hypothetical protein [Ligilactobacillus salivarius]OTF89881.1 hypothetical protein A8C38_06015 [Ligilactobacillus salivarius]PAY27875.1 hypothetical protein A8C33_05490 [Ligilactobacillus salivarius]PAY29215.1 hypothetical protein A8C44_01830 [Ligilactobacillus salivarius]PAY29996.1 hypothetical protein A8C49_05185 [Ligilactobacillus salivarius]PAY36591.1 hypothetical protein A8C50_04985 [Ligilactobacillus salivarius]
MSRTDKYSKQRIDKLKELCVKHPDYLMQELAKEMGLNVSDVFIIIKSYDLPYNWKFTKNKAESLRL